MNRFSILGPDFCPLRPVIREISLVKRMRLNTCYLQKTWAGTKEIAGGRHGFCRS